ENTGLQYASTTRGTSRNGDQVGVMHAYGHDVHMTVFTGTARTLIKLKNQWKGTLIMIVQSAEEAGLWADLLFKNDFYNKVPRPDFAIAVHCYPYLDAGKVGDRSGPVLARVDMRDRE